MKILFTPVGCNYTQYVALILPMGLNNFWYDGLELEGDADADVNEAAEGEGIGMSSSAVN